MKKMTLLAFMLVTILLANAQTKNFIDQPYIEVNGNADTLVTPNEIYIRILLSEKDTRDRVFFQAESPFFQAESPSCLVLSRDSARMKKN